MATYYYNVSDVAVIFGVNRQTVIDWICRGELRAVWDWTFDRRDYRGYRITEQAVEDFMTESINRLSTLLAVAERKEREAMNARRAYEEAQRYWNACFAERINRKIR